jgi:hypothetical protein
MQATTIIKQNKSNTRLKKAKTNQKIDEKNSKLHAHKKV